MIQKQLAIRFGSGDSRVLTGLSPTFVVFKDFDGNDVTSPLISEIGTGTGLYKFEFGYTLGQIAFLCDGGSSLPDSDRYVAGTLDPIQAIDRRLGTEDQGFGSDVVDPSSVYEFSKRFLEFLEGNAGFEKSTGTWQIFDRGGTFMLREKTLTNTVSEATKT